MRQPSNPKRGIWILILVGIFVWVGIIGRSCGTETKPLTASEPREKSIADSTKLVEDAKQSEMKARAEFLRNLRYKVKHHIKENLKDPDSFQEIDHQEYAIEKPTKKRHFQAWIKYRAKNSFGGYNIEQWCFDFDENGENTKVFECN
ncbi:MAG: hypothetical protein J7619_22995 [Dyadobacter sp.]|uniref:hypothetical protein n=1 Tax=Dyadobacter sp. TaxID=1914288 RepID=UPI001B1C63B4|nr:hypothetical protein [Dyadobacter sp.]MBO9615584.1 hypothetical protein [Dyadobacter sp.]